MEDLIKGIKDATGMTTEEIENQISANGFSEITDNSYEAGYQDGLAFMEIYGA